ncbi:hypothetical protein PMAYCL1PPCAC_17777, partial [Pristionchus mayeri]
ETKKNCRLCSAHGTSTSAVSHICPHADCQCSKCKLIRKRRAIVAEQTRIRRTQKKVLHSCVSPSDSSSSSESPQMINRTYLCQRCQNHGIVVSKKNHYGKCSFALCRCSKCELWTNRSFLDEELKRNTNGDSNILSNSNLYSEPDNSEIFPVSLPSTSSAALLTSSLPSIPPNSIIVHHYNLEKGTYVFHPSQLPPGIVEKSIAENTHEFVPSIPVLLT